MEACRSLDVLRWQKDRLIRPLFSSYGSQWVWSDPETGEQTASIGFDTDCHETHGSVRLHYTITRDEEKIPVDYRVSLTTTRTAWGALRWWFTCPLVKDGRPCRRRVRKLYLAYGGNYYGCRHCYQLTYESCQESHKYDLALGALGRDMGLSLRQGKKMLEKRS